MKDSDPNRLIAVITGDVVGSARFAGAARARLHNGLRQAADDLERAFAAYVPYPIAFFRGDSWQFLVTEPSMAIRMGLYFRSASQSLFGSAAFDTRMAIGVGTISFLPEDDVSAGDGEAFRRSGEALNDLGRERRMVFIGPPSMSPFEQSAISAITGLIDAIASNWTARQAQAVAGALRGWTQQEIGSNRFEPPITQQGVAQHLDRASWDSIEDALEVVENETARLHPIHD
ncbi:MAG: hypothetical protein WBR18_14465 [Anaerolineales bacterium]